jgi:hypothetical protein
VKMKYFLAILLLFLISLTCVAQGTSSVVEITTVYSQNGEYYLKTIPYDNEFPTLRGKTYVYNKKTNRLLYSFERGFDGIQKDNNLLTLSNNGEIIFYVIDRGAKDKIEGLGTITMYKNGKYLKSLIKNDLVKCDSEIEKCWYVIYSNYDEVIDREKSNWGSKKYKRAFKKGISEKEKFLFDFSIFSHNDTVYITDIRKQTHLFDLKEGIYIKKEPFDSIYEYIKEIKRFNKTVIKQFESPQFDSRLHYFPNLKNKQNTFENLANYIGWKSADWDNEEDKDFKSYSLEFDCIITQSGEFEFEKIIADSALPKEKIIAFFKANKFDISIVPKELEKWHIHNPFYKFRKTDDELARKEKKEELVQEEKAKERRMMLDSISGVYIPKDLGECFIQLDKLLKEVDKKEMKELKSRMDMIQYHHGMGMWLRNNWGLWAGSRLQKYFTDKKIQHPDSMSSVILYFYYDWLTGKKETWKEWEKNPANR